MKMHNFKNSISNDLASDKNDQNTPTYSFNENEKSPKCETIYCVFLFFDTLEK